MLSSPSRFGHFLRAAMRARRFPLAGLCMAGLLVFGCAPRHGGVEDLPPDAPRGIAPIEIPWAHNNTVESNNIYGYNVHRSGEPTEGFVKINDDLILPSPEDPNPPFVVFLDRPLPLGETYYYYLEAVLQDGRRMKATPVYPLRVVREMNVEELEAWKAEAATKAKEGVAE